MSFTLTIPDDLYSQVQSIADRHDRPIEEVLIDHLKLLTLLTPDEEAELKALRQLSDDALWTIAREQLPVSLQERLQTLMDRNTNGQITPDEYHELEGYVARGDRLMIRKAEAATILQARGYSFSQQDFLSRND